jgi:Protein of unknown function (DUF1552)
MTGLNRISRRDIFARFGPAAVFAIAAMRGARGWAQAASKKGKFIAFHTTSGFVLEPFWGGINTGTLRANNFAGKSLEPLSEYAARSLMFRDVGHGNPGASYFGKGDQHNMGSVFLLTGRLASADGSSDNRNRLAYATGPSLDEVLSRSRRQKSGIRARIAFSNPGENRPSAYLSYASNGVAIGASASPQTVFKDVFGQNGAALNILCSNQPSPNPNPVGPTPLQQSMIDANQAEFDRLLRWKKLSAEEKAIVENMMAQFREVEVDVAGTGNPGVNPASQDTAAAKPWCDQLAAQKYGLPAGADPNANELQKRAELWFDIVTLAFALDLADAAVLSWGPGGTGSQPYGGISYNSNGQQYTTRNEEHHPTSHYSINNIARGREIVTAIDRWHAARLKSLLDRLNSFKSGTAGTTLLDDTMVYWGSEISEGNPHNSNNIPLTIWGGKNLGVPQGEVRSYKNASSARILSAMAVKLGLQESDISTPMLREGGPLF